LFIKLYIIITLLYFHLILFCLKHYITNVLL
jgi:hypothetical protein